MDSKVQVSGELIQINHEEWDLARFHQEKNNVTKQRKAK